MTPSIGRIVHYRLSKDQATELHPKRLDGMRARFNPVDEGTVLPAIVTAVWSPTTVNLQVFLDGELSIWVTSATEGDGPRQWFWPPQIQTVPATEGAGQNA